jgi:MYXO-CTERM domain-containing protein
VERQQSLGNTPTNGVREHRATVSRRLTPLAIALLIGSIAGLSLICALAVHHTCVNPGPPVERPESGTPLADYCSSADSDHPWPLTLLPAAVAALGIVAVGRRKRWTAIICVGVATATVTNAIIVSGLTFSYTI